MSIKDIKLNINPKLSEISKRILEFNEEIGNARGTPKRFSIIASYLVIYKRLTQNDLKTLTNFSLSNISYILNSLLNARIIKKALIPKSNEFEYFLSSNIINTNRKMIDGILVFSDHAQKFFTVLLEQLNNPGLSTLSGYNILYEQIQFIINDFSTYALLIRNLFQNFKNDNEPEEIDISTYIFSKSYDLFVEIEFDEKLVLFEQKIIGFLHDTLFSNSKGPANLVILPYFFTRGMLMQKQIKKLTNLSVGAISQGLKDLETRHLIEKRKNLPRIYRIRSVSLAVVYRLYKMFSIIIDWNEKFNEMKTTLEKEADMLKGDVIYSNIKLYVDEILKITPMYEDFNSILSKLID
ncbi:MAG: hypothetical protein GY870_13665 [archaeon]|nr:hypothetical protein [archaeon]